MGNVEVTHKREQSVLKENVQKKLGHLSFSSPFYYLKFDVFRILFKCSYLKFERWSSFLSFFGFCSCWNQQALDKHKQGTSSY